MDSTESLFLEALRYGLAGAPVPWTEPPDLSAQKTLARLARAQAVTPLIAQALFGCSAMAGSPVLETMRREARQLTIRQATRTAEFLLLLRDLDARGLRPLVLKGAVCRSLYPEPEQRPSVDEDLLIPPGDFPAYHAALLAYGLRLMDPEKPMTAEYRDCRLPGKEGELVLFLKSAAGCRVKACINGIEKACWEGETRTYARSGMRIHRDPQEKLERQKPIFVELRLSMEDLPADSQATLQLCLEGDAQLCYWRVTEPAPLLFG